MADGGDTITARTISSIEDIGAVTWDTLANPTEQTYNPFVAYDFLAALEKSGSATSETGWAPMHLLVEEAGDIIAAAPLYAKNHSQGEYIFDHHWADAYERAGGRYYPKLLCAAPFTPANGPRLLATTDTAKRTLAAGLKGICENAGLSSVHVNFTSDRDQQILQEAGYLARMSEQYHWFNRGYKTFDDFLAALSSRKRKTIRRERRDAQTDDVTIRRLIGDEISEQHWDAFWQFYQDTGARKWGYPYLTREFFEIVARSMGERILFIVAERDGAPIAGALNFIGGDTLYGRYWGCVEDVSFLHFELCYYQAIEFAIENGLSCVEAGAQGQHKIARGYEPVAIHSAHWFPHEGFSGAIERYLTAEREQTGAEIDALKNFTPFKKS